MEKSLEQIEFETRHDVWIKVNYEGPLLTPDGHENEHAIFRLSKFVGFSNWIKRSLNDPRKYRKPTDEEVKILAKVEYERLISGSLKTPEISVTDNDARKQPEESVKILDTTKTSNYFRREDSFWRIGYEGESAVVKDVSGIRYITLLLERHGDALSCIGLYQAVSGQIIDDSASKRMAADEDLSTTFSKQDVSSQEARAAYYKRYIQLEDELLKINDLPDHERTPEDEFRKKEIEEEMAKLEPHLKERAVFVDPNNKKAQTNIKRRLDEAYNAIRGCGMKKLATHLKDHIKPNGAYGLQYVGSVAWEISS